MAKQATTSEDELRVNVDAGVMDALRNEYPGKTDEEISRILIGEFLAENPDTRGDR